MDNLEPISLDTTPTQPTISLDTGNPNNAVPNPLVASARASKAEYGLSPITGHTYKDAVTAIQGGNEDNFRIDAAAKVDNDKRVKFAQGVISPSQVVERTDPKSVVEKFYAQQYLKPVYDVSSPFISDSPMSDAINEIPEHVHAAVGIGEDMITKREMLLARAQNMQRASEQAPWAQSLVETLSGAIPGYSQLLTRGNVPTDVTHLLPGEDILEQSKAAYRMNMDTFTATMDKIEQGLGQNYPGVAAKLFQDLAGMGTDDQILNDQVGLIDLSMVAGPVSGVLSHRLGLFNHVRGAVQDAVKSTEHVGGIQEPALPADIAAWENEGGAAGRTPIKVTNIAATGNLREAAVERAASNLVADLENKSTPTERSVQALLSEHRVDVAELKKSARPDEQELVNRIEEDYRKGDTDVVTATMRAFKVNRTPLLETSKDVVRAIENRVKETWSGVKNKVLDTDTVHDPVTNTYNHIMKLGNEDATLFEKASIATKNAELNGFIIKRGPTQEGFLIKRQGNGYYIEYTKPVPEDARFSLVDAKGEAKEYSLSSNPPTTKIKGDFSLWKKLTTSKEDRALAHGETPYLRDQGILKNVKALLGWIRTPDETIARDLREQLKVATHTIGGIRSPAVKTFKQVQAVPYRLWNDFNRILEEAQKIPDPNNNNIPGKYFSLPELKNQYMTTLKRLPEESEVRAYFAFKRNQDYDLFLRRVASYIPKARLGAEQYQFSVYGGVGKPKIKSGFFEGITHVGLPAGEDNIYVAKTGEVYKANDVKFLKERKRLAELVKDGQAKVVEVIDPDRLPFEHMSEKTGQNRIRYAVIEGTSETKPLSLLDQVPRRGGGHIVPEYEHYGKQANVRRSRVGSSTQDHYIGDNTLMPFADRVTGREIIGKLNAIRDRWNTDGINGAKDEHSKQNFPVDWKQVRGWFKESRTPEGVKVPPRFSLKEPFHLLKADEQVIDKDPGLPKRYEKTFTDGTKAGSLARTFKVEYTDARDARDLMTINDVGSKNNPVYKYEPGKLIDPITAQNRGLQRIINSNVMNDIKTLALNKWLHDAEPHLQADPSEIWHSPYHYFNHGIYKPNTDINTKNLLNSNWLKLQNFLGTQSVVDNFLHDTAQELADAIHGVAGPKLVPLSALSKIKDPTAFIRSMTSHAILGLGSIKQFFTQWTTHTNIFGMSPRSAPAGSMATLLHSWTAINADPGVIAHMDQLASKLAFPGFNTFKPGQFTEAHDLLRRSGFITVAEEHALARNLPGAAKLVKTAGVNILDWGLTPFKLGAESVRASAGYTAYLEFRAEHPTGRMTRADEAKWLDRASLLDHNMSRASNSILHTGIMSTPGQFFAYDLRLAELMWGKRLAPIDKARLFAASSIMYGIPLGGVGLSGIPLYKYIRSQMEQNHEYVVGDNFVKSVLMEGLPSAIGASITSHDGWNPQYGNWYDFSKFGAKGADYLDDLNSDVSWWKVVGGASASVFSAAFKNTSNFRAAVMPHFLGGVDGFPFKIEDMTDALKTLSFGSKAMQFKAALNTGKWVSNNGQVIDDKVGVGDAAFMALTGTQHVEYLDQYLKQEQIKDQEAFERQIFNQFLQNFTRYCQAEEQGDAQQAKDYKTRAFAILDGPGGYPEELKPQAVAAACRGNESSIKAIDQRFYTGRQVPAGQEDQMLDAWKKTINRQEGMGR